MLGIAGLSSVSFAVAAASLARRLPARIETVQAGIGRLLIGGFALIGCALPIML
jgi:hypothetical protein